MHPLRVNCQGCRTSSPSQMVSHYTGMSQLHLRVSRTLCTYDQRVFSMLEKRQTWGRGNVLCDFGGGGGNAQKSAPSKTTFGGLRKWDWSGRRQCPLREMTAMDEWGGKRIIGGGGGPKLFWGRSHMVCCPLPRVFLAPSLRYTFAYLGVIAATVLLPLSSSFCSVLKKGGMQEPERMGPFGGCSASCDGSSVEHRVPLVALALC